MLIKGKSSREFRGVLKKWGAGHGKEEAACRNSITFVEDFVDEAHENLEDRFRIQNAKYRDRTNSGPAREKTVKGSRRAEGRRKSSSSVLLKSSSSALMATKSSSSPLRATQSLASALNEAKSSAEE
eukprot:GHVU01021593.1.p1 GENE.GHVU01021593.1~~GHVU01021593.1.p1  ORF type:complete len:127 (+),score=22.80 GHVU01021593.1:106-486(+)